MLELRRTDPALAWMLTEELRLPRTLLALGYGAVLGMTGAALQAMFANPLASPDITGSSSGAALGAVAGSYWLGITGPLALAACGATGAALALAALFAVAGRRSETATLLLAGVAIALAAGAGTSLLLALAPSPFAFYDSFEWLMGSFVDRSLPQAAAALIPAARRLRPAARRARALDMMALGDDVAASVGYPPQAPRRRSRRAQRDRGWRLRFGLRSNRLRRPDRAVCCANIDARPSGPSTVAGSRDRRPTFASRGPAGPPRSGWPCNSRGRRDDRNRDAPVHLDRRENAPDGGVMTPALEARGLSLGNRLQATRLAVPIGDDRNHRPERRREDKPAPGACGYRA